jgi:Pyruvate/2-oxoacid:ferredoxin oxidoreductase delta subunit
MIRQIIDIDEEKCNGCGLCIPNCPEGAIRLIDGKARMISDLFCDGLGACIGHCPEGAISIEEREAEAYDERRVMENIVQGGENVIAAHLQHMEEHGEYGYLSQAKAFLRERGIALSTVGRGKEKAEVGAESMESMHKGTVQEHNASDHGGCPGSRVLNIETPGEVRGTAHEGDFTELTHWPVQLHLTPAMAPHFAGKDILLSADCVAYTLGNFHRAFLRGKMLAIACPKLDSEQEIYREKITALIDHAKINTLTVMTMEVPCCSGLLMLAKEAAAKASRNVPLKSVVVSVKGQVLQEEWL